MSTDQTVSGEQNHGFWALNARLHYFLSKLPHMLQSPKRSTHLSTIPINSPMKSKSMQYCRPICLMIENRFTLKPFPRWVNHLNSISSITTLCKFSNCVMFIFGLHIRYSIRGAAYQTKTACFPYSTCMKYFPRTGLFEKM